MRGVCFSHEECALLSQIIQYRIDDCEMGDFGKECLSRPGANRYRKKHINPLYRILSKLKIGAEVVFTPKEKLLMRSCINEHYEDFVNSALGDQGNKDALNKVSYSKSIRRKIEEKRNANLMLL